MPTAVVVVDLEQTPHELTGLGRYDAALVLVRVRSRPVGELRLPVVGGRIDGVTLRRALQSAVTEQWPVWEILVHDYLGYEQRHGSGRLPPSATVAVCTRDRPDDLRRCLDALMRLPDDGQEFLIIDNCPSGPATGALVGAYPRVRYVHEPRPGLNVARNRALREARHELVAFTDDDAAPDPLWLRALTANFDDPLVLCATGLTVARELETPAQEFFEARSPFKLGFWRRTFDPAWHNPLQPGCGAGVNMALRRSALSLVGPFDEALDAGTPTCSGGDTELFARILSAGYRLVYDPAALSWHRHRRTWPELRENIRGYAVGTYAWLTRRLLRERETGVLRLALAWLCRLQLPWLVRSLLRRPGSDPLRMVLEQLRAAASGPAAYLRSRRRLPRVARVASDALSRECRLAPRPGS
jgi:GT2 family glycosyltransferase